MKLMQLRLLIGAAILAGSTLTGSVAKANAQGAYCTGNYNANCNIMNEQFVSACYGQQLIRITYCSCFLPWAGATYFPVRTFTIGSCQVSG